jgi:hypothetical protein
VSEAQGEEGEAQRVAMIGRPSDPHGCLAVSDGLIESAKL